MANVRHLSIMTNEHFAINARFSSIHRSSHAGIDPSILESPATTPAVPLTWSAFSCSPAYCFALAWLNGNCNCNCRRIASPAQLAISKRSQTATKLRQGERERGEEMRWEANDRLRWKADSQGNDMQLQLLFNETSWKHAAPIGLYSMRAVGVSACLYLSVCVSVYLSVCVCVYCKTVTRQLSMRNVLRAFKTYSYLMGLACRQFDII